MSSNFEFLCQLHLLHWIPTSDAEELIKFQWMVVYQADMKGECCAFQASDNNAEVRGNHEFQASDNNAEVRGNHEFQASTIWQ